MNPRGRNQKIERPVVIAVEGMDEFSTLIRLVEHFEIPQCVQFFVFREVGGNLQNCLEALLKTPGFDMVKYFGAIGDCETSRSATDASYINSFSRNGYEAKCGEWAKSNEIHCGFLLLPTEKDSGCLEDVYIDSISDPNRLKCGSEFLACLRGNGLGKPGGASVNQWESKIVARSVILGHNDPALPLGSSYSTSLWNKKSSAFSAIAKFLREAADGVS